MNLLIKSPLRFSLIAIVFVVLMFVILIFLDKNPVVYSSNIIFIGPLLAIFLFFSVKIFRDANPDGLRFWQGFSIGMLYIIFFISYYAIILTIISYAFDVNYFDEYRELSVERVYAQKELILEKFDNKFFEESLLESRNQTNFDIILRLCRNFFGIGILLVPIVSLFMRTPEQKQP
ncbi:DUF4199 domain-containing protein [Marivirga arenosa]|uniref:DUF4199 domain-containing protein n=1 Tax=Marivirga arenosa TaxID=3059076 RepID=A0AA49GIX1_9BACT|nr:DUF4199 domain-containing protein [Marivirga sp. ABR2-2]WKK87324.2 DUF4199 domain-containing protein [Marivirga sp. ABR2-2]